MQFWKYMTADDTGGSGQSLIQSALNDKLVEEIGICQGETFKEKEETDGLTLLIICACITTALGLVGVMFFRKQIWTHCLENASFVNLHKVYLLSSQLPIRGSRFKANFTNMLSEKVQKQK